MVLKREAAKPHNIHDLVQLHVESSARIGELMVLCATQRDAGKLKVARQTFVQIERLQAEITALEERVRPKPR